MESHGTTFLGIFLLSCLAHGEAGPIWNNMRGSEGTQKENKNDHRATPDDMMEVLQKTMSYSKAVYDAGEELSKWHNWYSEKKGGAKASDFKEALGAAKNTIDDLTSASKGDINALSEKIQRVAKFSAIASPLLAAAAPIVIGTCLDFVSFCIDHPNLDIEFSFKGMPQVSQALESIIKQLPDHPDSLDDHLVNAIEKYFQLATSAGTVIHTYNDYWFLAKWWNHKKIEAQIASLGKEYTEWVQIIDLLLGVDVKLKIDSMKGNVDSVSDQLALMQGQEELKHMIKRGQASFYFIIANFALSVITVLLLGIRLFFKAPNPFDFQNYFKGQSKQTAETCGNELGTMSLPLSVSGRNVARQP